MKIDIIEKIDIPEGIVASVENNMVTVKNGNNKIERKFAFPNVSISKQNNNISISASKGTKREKRMINTFKAHIKNMINGVKSGYVYKVAACSSHFPMNISIEKGEMVIKNFLGEKVPRKTKVTNGVDVKIEGNIITLQGPNKEDVSGMASKIERLTNVKGRDRRVFQDGCYITEKAGKQVK